MCVADLTEIHHDAELTESVKEVNDIDIDTNESAISKVVPKETLTLIPLNSLFMFHIFTLNPGSLCWMQSC